jgi:hypothetical protein
MDYLICCSGIGLRQRRTRFGNIAGSLPVRLPDTALSESKRKASQGKILFRGNCPMEMQVNSSHFPHKITKKNSLYTKIKEYTQVVNSLFTMLLYNAD